MAKAMTRTGERKMKIRSQVGMVLNLDNASAATPVQLPVKTSGPAAKGGIRVVQQRGNQAGPGLPD